MKKTVLLFLIIVFAAKAYSQCVELKAPLLPGKQAKLYFFEGAKADSLSAIIDISGKASFTIPNGNYNGMAALIIPGAGGIEFVVGESSVSIECNTSNLNRETVVFPHSKENNFLKHIFTTQSRLLQQQAWLTAGADLFSGSPLLNHIQPELAKVESAMSALEMEISASDLYAARYFRLAGFMSRLLAVEQKRDHEAAMHIRHEMEETLDITALYTAGQLWKSVLNFYISLFNHTTNEGAKQKQYAASVLKTTQRLGTPYFEAYLAGCIAETERFGWQDARHEIVRGLLTQHKGFTSSYTVLQRAIGAYHVSTDRQLPPIAGLKESKEPHTKILIAFHDSDCSTCLNEMTRLRQIYPQLKEKGIRVVSIAADTDKKKFEAESRHFEWEDKLCDYNGFSGVNFSNYNVAGSPSFYVTDANGKLLGMYFSVDDMENDL